MRVIALALIALGTALCQSPVSLSVSGPSTGTAPGKTATVSINLSSTTAPAGTQWTLTYSPTDISSVTWATGAAGTAASKTVQCNTTSAGAHVCLVSGLNVATIGSGAVAVATVTVNPTSKALSTPLSLLATYSADPTGSNLVTSASAPFNFIIQSPCDVNGDGSLTSADTGAAIQQALGLAACGSADVDGNGRCDIVDVIRVLIAANGGACRTGL